MILPSPVTVRTPNFAGPRAISELHVSFLDVPAIRRVTAMLLPGHRPLVLWEGDAYDDAGDYTQAQVEARVLEVLGPDIQAGLEALFVPPKK